MSTVAVQINGLVVPMGENVGIPGDLSFPLKASASAARGQFVTIDPATGLTVLADDATPGQISGGYIVKDEVTALSTVDGAAVARVTQRWATHAAPSTISNDGFTKADVAVPFYLADGNTPGKLSNSGGKNRSLGGLVFGVEETGETPIRIWTGPVAQLLARAALAVNAASAGLVAYPQDATSSTDIGSTSAATSSLIIPRTKTHGVITSIEIIPSAALSATSGNDRTITIWKLDTLGVASPVSVATYTTTTALVAQQPTAFTLTATTANLNLLETDILSYSTVHASGGATIPQSAIRLNMKVN